VSAQNESSFDVIIIGAGNAAFAAALAARNRGCRVLVLEKAPEAERGGNTRFSGGVFRTVYGGLNDLASVIGDNDDPSTVIVEPYSREAYLHDLARVSGGRNDPTLSAVLVDQSWETVKWMAKLGIQFEFSRDVGAVTVASSTKTKLQFGCALRAKHEGLGLSKGWFKIAEAAGVEIRYEVPVTRLLTDQGGAICGVEYRGKAGLARIPSLAVIIASGGFQANPEMRTAYLGPAWSLVKVRGTRFNTGEVMRAAMDLGAQSFGHWAGCHATPIDADAPNYGVLKLTDKTNRLSYPYSIMINLDGKRFLDEGADLNLYTYAKYGGQILAQRGSMAFQIFDSKTIPLLEARYSTGTPVAGNTLAELLDGIEKRFGLHSFDKKAALATVKRFNEAANDAAGFDPNILDRKSTRGLDPEKTNWAMRVDEGPFQAFAVTGGITFTFGGLRIDEHARVLDGVDRPIPALFATGEAMGFYWINYPGASGLMRGAVFGKIAGESAAELALQKNARSAH
jgi:tricarballylate dehydrogenase